MYRRVCSFFSWLFYGYSGRQKREGQSTTSKVLRFSGRFLFFYAITLHAWHSLGQFYEAFLWQTTLRLGYLISDLPLGMPEINIQGRLSYSIGNLVLFPLTDWQAMSTTTAVPLLLASSGIPGRARGRMILLGMLMLFLFQILNAVLSIYAYAYNFYLANYTNETMRLFEFLVYREADARIIFWLGHVSNVFARQVETLGIWVGLVYWFKRERTGSPLGGLL